MAHGFEHVAGFGRATSSDWRKLWALNPGCAPWRATTSPARTNRTVQRASYTQS